MISVKNLSKYYGTFCALNDVNMSIESGKTIAILGPNGAGKSTFLNILSTAMLPTSGEIVYDGLTVSKNATAIRKRFGVVFQETILDKELSAFQNLEIHAELYGIREDVGSKVQKALEEVGLWEKRNVRISFFSGGMKRKLELAKCLIHEPEIIILDEPTTGLDVKSRKEIWECIHRLNKEKKVTVFLATHYIEEASMCDYVYIIDKGRIIEEGDVATLLKKYSKTKALIKVDSENEKKIRGLSFERRGEYLEMITDESVAVILKKLYDANVQIDDLMIEPSSLEDAYLRITGGDISTEQYTEVK